MTVYREGRFLVRGAVTRASTPLPGAVDGTVGVPVDGAVDGTVDRSWTIPWTVTWTVPRTMRILESVEPASIPWAAGVHFQCLCHFRPFRAGAWNLSDASGPSAGLLGPAAAASYTGSIY